MSYACSIGTFSSKSSLREIARQVTLTSLRFSPTGTLPTIIGFTSSSSGAVGPSGRGMSAEAKYRASTPANESGLSSRTALDGRSREPAASVMPLMSVLCSPTKRTATSRTASAPQSRDTLEVYHHPSVGSPVGPSMAYSTDVVPRIDAIRTMSSSRYGLVRPESAVFETSRYSFETSMSNAGSDRVKRTLFPSSATTVFHSRSTSSAPEISG